MPRDTAAASSAGARHLRLRGEVDSDLRRVNDQLAALLDEQHQRRLALTKRNEEITRGTVDVEVEIRRLENVNGQLAALSEQRVELEGNRRRLDRETGDLTREDDGLKEDNDKLGAERSRLDKEVARLKRLRQDYISAIAQFRSQKEGVSA